MRAVAGAVLGFVLWLVTQVVGLLMNGAGHGWGAPTVLSMVLIVLYPMAMVRAIRLIPPVDSLGRMGPIPALVLDIGLLVAAVTLDTMLLDDIRSAENMYFMNMWRLAPSIVRFWFVLWFGWQVAVLCALWKTIAMWRGLANSAQLEQGDKELEGS